MVKKDGATASIEENAEVQAPTEEQSNVQSSTAESVEMQAPNEEDAEMQALFEGLDGNEPEQSGAEETAPKGKPTRADVLKRCGFGRSLCHDYRARRGPLQAFHSLGRVLSEESH